MRALVAHKQSRSTLTAVCQLARVLVLVLTFQLAFALEPILVAVRQLRSHSVEIGSPVSVDIEARGSVMFAHSRSTRTVEIEVRCGARESR